MLTTVVSKTYQWIYDEFNNYIGPELDSDESEDEDNAEEEREHSEGMVRFSCNNI